MATGVPSTKQRLLSVFGETRRMQEQGSSQEFLQATVEGVVLLGIQEESFQELRRKFVAKPSDVFVVTYPKCGTTWMQQIATLIKNSGVDDGIDLDERWQWIELFTAEEVEVIDLLFIFSER